MVGNVDKKKYHKQLHASSSTPVESTAGVAVPTPFAKLATYTVNVRSFHPNKNFEPLGFRFHGDDRGFSDAGSFFGQRTNPNDVTSRVWQRFDFDAGISRTGDLSETKSSNFRTESNPSSPGPNLWSVLGHTEDYKPNNLKPHGKLEATYTAVPHGGQKELSLKSWYGGENHAFLGSVAMKDTLGVTHVPTLDVFSELFMRVERVRLYVDIYSLVYGDGFPNAESFITDSKGTRLMLGTHVRIGAPATHLWGEGHRLMWANAIRMEIDADGNFGNKLWVFARVLGGPPELRDEYVTSKYPERCVAGSKPHVFSNPFNDSPPTFTWNCGKVDAITKRGADAALPLHLSAFTDLTKVRQQLAQVWLEEPARKGTLAEWNDSHLHRDPNGGRSPDSYDVAPEKWKK